MQKCKEETEVSYEKYEAVQGVNQELHKIIEKLQKENKEKQNTLESLTQGKENLDAILGTKINNNKHGLGFVLTIKKKFDVKIATFVSKKGKSKITPLINMSCLIKEKPTQTSDQRVGQNKQSQKTSKENKKIIRINLNNKKPMFNQSKLVGLLYLKKLEGTQNPHNKKMWM